MTTQDARVYSHSRALRERLRAERNDQNLSALEVSDRVRRILGEMRPASPQRIYSWEKFQSHPGIDKYAAWARALGMRLELHLVEADSDAKATLLHSDEAAKVARMIDLAPPADRARVLDLVARYLNSEPD